MSRVTRPLEIFADRVEEIVGLPFVDRGGGGVAGEILVGGADQREVALVGNGEADAAVGILENIGAIVIEQPIDDDVAALDEAHLHRRVQANDARRSRRATHGPPALTKARAVTVS